MSSYLLYTYIYIRNRLKLYIYAIDIKKLSLYRWSIPFMIYIFKTILLLLLVIIEKISSARLY